MASHGRNTLASRLRHRGDGRGPLSFVVRHHRGIVAAVALVLVAVALVVWPYEMASERRALLRMNPDARRELYVTSQRDAQAICAQAQHERALDDRCVDSATFLLSFPECDQACQAFAEAHQRRPTR
ncbi:MAG: hypothetical protein JWP87_5481 [Labilithrix sp.]|jgi:hypothetical protein|nr:hypothetical protein [Labilithrix sp.]